MEGGTGYLLSNAAMLVGGEASLKIESQIYYRDGTLI
jgi:hypothetical protein